MKLLCTCVSLESGDIRRSILPSVAWGLAYGVIVLKFIIVSGADNAFTLFLGSFVPP